jgi:hypothetical protein
MFRDGGSCLRPYTERHQPVAWGLVTETLDLQQPSTDADLSLYH